MGTPVNIIVGSHVWLEDPGEAWVDGVVTEIRGRDATIATTNGKTVVASLGSIYPKDTEAPPSGVDDMTKLAYLHEPGVLHNLACRYGLNEIYTYTGNILIAVNPFQRLPHLYDVHMMEQYKGATFGELSPHLFAIADACYRALINDHGSQSILVSGESGAGKTETTKMLMRYLAFMGGRSGTEGRTVEQQVLESNPVLEAFGNAKTVKNNNSRWTLEPSLRCDEKSLEDSLCQRVIVTPDGNITKPLDPDSAALSRDALAKTVYSRLFDWIVDKINNSIGQDPDATNIIGVLDIYGFESFKINSFEQLCINLTNEKLQQHFNQHVFKMEQEEYTREEIDWSYVEFVDNQDVLDLIEKKPGGIIALLDEACMFPKSTHETFAQKMYQTYKAHKRFSKPKLARTAFTINHYAGDVTYQADQFLDKNKDYVVAEHQALLNSSRCHFVANLFPPLPEETSKQSKFSSIGTRFKQQLQSLMETLSTTEPHYIRCVKPNTVLKPGIFENFNVLNQLRCGGVLEAIRISCAGYPTKRTFDEFIDRFGMLAPELVDSSDEKAACAAICDRMGLKGYQIGKTKTRWRQHKAYVAYKQQKRATLILQCLWRARIARKELRKLKMEARETGALKEAKDKLEKRVEELTWRLDVEKRLRTDLEEAKGQEIAKLQSALQEMQSKIEEAHTAIAKEREAAKLAIEQAPPKIVEVPVVDTAKVEELTSKNKELEDELSIFKQKAEDLEERFLELQKRSDELSQETQERESKVIQLQEIIERLETGLSNMESENQVLRQQSLVVASADEDKSKRIERLESKIAILESDIQLLHSNSARAVQAVATPEMNQTSVMENLIHKEIDNGHQIEEVKIVNEQVVVPPVKNLSKQRSLTDRQQGAESSGELAYWLSTTSTLLCLLQNTLKASSSSSKGSSRSRTATGSLFGRMVQSARISSSGLGVTSGYSGMVGRPDTASMVEAKYPALRFKQQLTAYVEKIYGIIRDNLKKEISPFLTLCIQAPRANRVRTSRGSLKSIHSNALSRQASSVHWQSIVKCLDHTLETMKNNHVPPMIIKKTFSQVYAYLNVQLFNSLLLRRECCSFSNGEFLKAGLQELEQWCSRSTEEYAGASWDELQHIRQAVGFLVLHQKSHKNLEEITNELCPVLSITQIYRIATMFWDDKYGAQGLSQEVIGNMRTMTTDDSITPPNSSFLLDDDSSIPISLDDIARLMLDIDPSDVEPPPLLRQNSQFHFLLQQHTD
nr:unnamed protein product [Digitaria exilis]